MSISLLLKLEADVSTTGCTPTTTCRHVENHLRQFSLGRTSYLVGPRIHTFHGPLFPHPLLLLLSLPLLFPLISLSISLPSPSLLLRSSLSLPFPSFPFSPLRSRRLKYNLGSGGALKASPAGSGVAIDHSVCFFYFVCIKNPSP